MYKHVVYWYYYMYNPALEQSLLPCYHADGAAGVETNHLKQCLGW